MMKTNDGGDNHRLHIKRDGTLSGGLQKQRCRHSASHARVKHRGDCGVAQRGRRYSGEPGFQ